MEPTSYVELQDDDRVRLRLPWNPFAMQVQQSPGEPWPSCLYTLPGSILRELILEVVDAYLTHGSKEERKTYLTNLRTSIDRRLNEET